MNDSTEKTFEECYCAARGCNVYEARSQLFWASLHRRALPLVPLISLIDGGYFYADVDVITRCSAVTNHAWLEEELAEYRRHPMNKGFFRRMGFRLSTRRLTKIAKKYLPE